MRVDLTTRILAVVIALFLWAYVRIASDTVYATRLIEHVPVNIVGKPPAGLSPELHVNDQFIGVRIKGPVNVLNSVFADKVRARVDVSRIGAQTTRLPVTVEMPRGVWLAERPQDVTIITTPLHQERVPVTIAFITAPPPGASVGEYLITPSTVTVEGPKDALAALKYVTVAVDPGQRLSTGKKVVPYAVDANGERVRDVHVLEATVEVRMASLTGQPVTRQVAVRPPQLLNPPRAFTVTVSQVRPDVVTLSGDAALLEQQPAYVESEPINVNSIRRDETRTVRLRVPRGLTIVEGPEVRVDLQVHAR